MIDIDRLTDDPSPWIPMGKAIDLKYLGKLIEELGEAIAAASRCIIQGINECEPETEKPNREWLEDEFADVMANMNLVTAHFELDEDRMNTRMIKKMWHLKRWHEMLND